MISEVRKLLLCITLATSFKTICIPHKFIQNPLRNYLTIISFAHRR